MRRGEVWVANLNPNKGAEIGKVRPVLVVQDDALTDAGLRTVLVAPLTSQVRPGLEPLRVSLPARDRLQVPSQVVVEQLRALTRDRFGDGPLTCLTSAEMLTVEATMKAVLGIES